MCVSPSGKNAITHYEVIKEYLNISLVKFSLQTGRTHQIRVHLRYINHPIVGDNKYGDFEVNKRFEKAFDFKNQFLHANDIKFGLLDQPLSYLSQQAFEADMPSEYIDILKTL